MNLAEILDLASKILAVIAVILYQLGYMDAGTFMTIISGLAALMASLLIHRYGKSLRKALRRLFRPPMLIVKTLRGTLIIDRGCKICRHPKRHEIEKMLLEGKTYREIKEKYDVSQASLSRHLRNHMPRLILNVEELERLHEEHRIKQIDLQEELFKLLARLEELYKKLERLDQKFFVSEGKPKISPHAYIESVQERRSILAQIRDTLLTINELKTEIKTEKDLSELLQKLRAMDV